MTGNADDSCTSLTHGLQGVFVKYIQQETQTRVQIKGIGSGFVDQETGREADEPMYIHVTLVFPIVATNSNSRGDLSGPDEQQVARAKALTEDLLEVVHAEHGKVKAVVHAQQMELHQAQLQYAAYSAYVCITLLIILTLRSSAYLLDGVVPLIRFWFVWFLLLLTDRDCWQTQNPYTGAAPPPPGDAPPPPPGEAPPQPGAPPQQPQGTMDPAAYAQYWYARVCLAAVILFF